MKVDFRLKKPFNMQVWSSFQNDKNRTLPSNLGWTKAQTTEMTPYCKEYTKQLASLGLKTCMPSIGKTKNGYTFRRRCSDKDCKSQVNLRISKLDGTGVISFNSDCKSH